MPQLSLYLDEKTLNKLKIAAKSERLSVSRFAAKKLNEALRTEWPEGYSDLFGVIADDSFSVDRKQMGEDAPRETL